jgi:sporulation protein YlmC with PRC-barrel domain
MTRDRSTVTLDVPKEALQKAPTFRREHWPETVDPDWLAGVYNYYGYPPYPGLTEITVQHRRVARVTTLLGLNVRNRQRETVGEIEDFMIDVREGHIAYVLLGTGGILGVGERVRAVPWTAMRIEPVERVVVLDVDKEKLHNAPLWKRACGKRPPAASGLLGSILITGRGPTGKRGTEQPPRSPLWQSQRNTRKTARAGMKIAAFCACKCPFVAM